MDRSVSPRLAHLLATPPSLVCHFGDVSAIPGLGLYGAIMIGPGAGIETH